jgi:hypothetical protein
LACKRRKEEDPGTSVQQSEAAPVQPLVLLARERREENKIKRKRG